MTIFDLIDAGDHEGLRQFLLQQPGAAGDHDERGLSALMRAAYRGVDVFEAVMSADPPLGPFDRILAGKSDGLPEPDTWSPDGFTPLHIAAFSRNAEAARALLEAGADPNAIARASFATVTPLGTCAFAGANDVARVLLEFGADPEIATSREARPALVARANGNDELAELLGS